MQQSATKTGIHYGWFIVFTGMLCIFASLGLGRFAIGMLLPSMASSLGLSYSQMGMIGTVNFIGYLLSVFACGFVSEKIGSRKLITLSLFLVGMSMILISRSGNFYHVLFCYFFTGMGSGSANVPMMALVSSWFVSRRRGRATGFVVIGSGFAILLSGWLIPYINAGVGIDGWRLSWLVLGGLVLLVTIFCSLVLRNSPRELGLEPFGAGIGKSPTGKTASCEYRAMSRKDIFHLGAIYFLFGYTYVIYATFVVTALVQERGFSERAAGELWSWVGLLSLLSGPVFGTLSDKLGRKIGLVMVFSLQMIAYLLFAVGLAGLPLYLSIGGYGIVAWSIPSIMAALVGDYAGPQRAARVFGLVTFIFALGQIAGPYVAGFMAEATRSFSLSFYMAAGFAAVAVMLSLRLRDSPSS
jgi:MFS family permease